MPTRASVSRGYLWRLGLIALVCFAMAGWFLFDGAVTYPRQRQRALKYQELEEKGALDEWFTVAKERGWPVDNPGEPKTDFDIYTQFVIAGLLVIPGLIYLIRFLLYRGRWVEADDAGLRTSDGRQLEFGHILVLGKRKWKSKGIARIFYEKDGRRGKLVLDDWKYEAHPTRDILFAVESHLDDEQIIGGPPEPPPEDEEGADEEQGGANPDADPEAT